MVGMVTKICESYGELERKIKDGLRRFYIDDDDVEVLGYGDGIVCVSCGYFPDDIYEEMERYIVSKEMTLYDIPIHEFKKVMGRLIGKKRVTYEQIE